MTPSSSSAEPTPPPEYFRVSPPLLRRVPAVAKRGGRLSPKLPTLVLLALFAQAARRPKSELAIASASAAQMASVSFSPRMSEVLEDMGYRRRGPEFSGSAWSAVTGCIKRLAETTVTVPFMWKPPGKKVLAAAVFKGPLLELVNGDTSQVRLYGYSPPKDRYHALVPRRLLALRPDLSELGTRLACWLYAQHRGARKDGKLKHKWSMQITPEWLVEAKFLRSKNVRRATELNRIRNGFTNLEGLGLLSIIGSGWPFMIQLSPAFFHQDGAGE